MAGAYVSLVMNGLTGVDPSAKLVAVALADCANVQHNGLAFPAMATLVRMTGIGETQTRKHVQALVADGWLTIESAGNGGRGMATRYRLNLPKMRANAPAKHHGAPGGIGPDKPHGAPNPKLSTNGAEDRGVSGDEKGAAGRGKGCGGPDERVRPAAPELEVNRNKPEVMAIGSLIRSALNGNRKGLKAEGPEPEKSATRNGSASAVHQAPRSREEQLAFVERALAAKGKP